ncbi:hypothetical protein QVD17_14405 [Tagetes erecta]|uniref:Uncharacterized protein n=1 Tax=Tagetes erecta TaxID=13708 RepID=A0AAD8L4J8_TARER|nr:hypothetical protein QVD17_14405 [Tagetes erecta]
MDTFDTNKSTQGDENERKFGDQDASPFSTDNVFKSREDLLDWVKKVGRSLGYVIITKRSKKNSIGVVSKVGLICDRGGVYKSKSSIRKCGTKKINCPFELVGKYSKMYGGWTLGVICEKHNHEATPHMEGHPYAKRLSTNETRLVFDLSRKNVAPQAILSTLKEQNKNNVSTIETDTFMRQVVNGEERASPSLLHTMYTFDANKLKRTIDHTNPFAIRNSVQELDSAKYWPGTKDTEDLLLPRKQMLMPSFTRFPSLQADLKETNHVKCVSIANPMRDDVLMYYGGNDNEPTSAMPFQPYQDVNLNRPEGQFLLKHVLNGDISHDQSLMRKSGGERERECKTNIAVELTYKKYKKDDIDAEVEIKHDKYEFDGVQSNSDMVEECDHSFILNEDIGHVCRVCGAVERDIEFQRLKSSKDTETYFNEGRSDKSEYTAGMVLEGVKLPGKDLSMGDFLTNKFCQGDENEGNFGVENTSAFAPNMVFKSRQDLYDWVQKVGRARGYVIVTKRSKKNISGVIYNVGLMCDRGGICKSISSTRNSGTKKINCPFSLVGNYLKTYDVWTLRVICEKHNHEPAPNLEGHPYAQRLSADETRLVIDLSRKNVTPQAILATLKEQNKNNVSELKTIYNVRQKFRRTQYAETFMRQVVNSDERESPSQVDSMHTFDANKLIRTIDHTYSFATRNWVPDLDSARYGTFTKDLEDLLFPRKQKTTHVKDISIANPMRDTVVMKHFLDGDNGHTQSPMGRSEGGREREGESQTNTAVESDKECKKVDRDSDMEEDDLQYDVNFDGLADIWKEMTAGLEYSKDVEMDRSINQHAKDDEEECDHSFILKEDIGYVCRVCGLVERGIESIIDFKRPKRSKSTQTYYYEGRSDKSGESAGAVLDGVKSPGKDFSLREIYAHPWHKKQMKPHQIEGFNFLLSNLVSDNPGGCILAHAPGSGKTFMLISFIQSFMAKYPDARPLVVLPRGILATWKKEFKRWQVEDIPLLDCYSQKADNRAQQLEVLKEWANTRSILFLGYKQFSTIVCDGDRSSVATTCKEILMTFPSLVILDEGHTPRNKDTDVFTAVEKVQTPRKVVLSGTLYQNHVCEVFNILNLVRPQFLKMEGSKMIKRRILSRVSIESRRNLFKKSTDNEFYELVEHALLKDENFKRKVAVIEDLREMTRNVLHYYKGDFLDELPGHVDFSVFLDLSPRQKGEVFELKKLARKFKISSDGSAIYVHPNLKSLVKTTQEKNNDDVIRIDQVLEKLDEKEGVKTKFFLNLLRLCSFNGEKLLVFGQYLLPLKFLLRLTMKVKGWRLNKEIFMITGDHDIEEREVAMDQFNNSSDAKVFFGSIKACGEGISLVGASRIIILDVHLNPSVTRQAIGRAFRPGQVRKVYTYRLVAAGSPEEEDHTTCHRKESIAKMWFEYNEHCRQNEFEIEKVEIKDCGDQFLETPWLSEDVTALYKRKSKCLLNTVWVTFDLCYSIMTGDEESHFDIMGKETVICLDLNADFRLK